MLSVFSRSLFYMLWKKILWEKKHIIVTLYLSQYDCEGIAKRIIWGKNISWLDCICLGMIAKVLQRELYEEKRIMVKLYLSRYDCEGNAKKIIWGKTYHVFVSILSRFCKSQRVSLMREQVANWFSFSRHNAIFLSKLQTVFAILNILQSVHTWKQFVRYLQKNKVWYMPSDFYHSSWTFQERFNILENGISNWMWMHWRWQF